MQVDESHDGQEVALGLAETLEVVLRERPGTGFRWHLISDGQPVCRKTTESVRTAAEALGAEVSRSWQFEAVEPGLATIQLAHRRAWEPEPTRQFTLRVRVPA